jgi:hypothetical protein
MKHIILMTLLMAIPLYMQGQSTFEGRIIYKVNKNHSSKEDSVAYYQRLKSLFSMDIQSVKREIIVKGNNIKDMNYNKDGIITSTSLKQDNREVMYSSFSNRVINISKLPKERLVFIRKEKEEEIILGYKCQKYLFESICMGSKDTIYLWITDSFKPTPLQKGQLFQRYLQPQGLVLKIFHINKGKSTTITITTTIATKIDLTPLEDSIFELTPTKE